LMSMGALGVLLGLLAFVIIRKRKQKSQMNNLEMNA
jgi:LPXTG-motif cell wall-anchored protein